MIIPTMERENVRLCGCVSPESVEEAVAVEPPLILSTEICEEERWSAIGGQLVFFAIYINFYVFSSF